MCMEEEETGMERGQRTRKEGDSWQAGWESHSKGVLVISISFRWHAFSMGGLVGTCGRSIGWDEWVSRLYENLLRMSK